MDDAESMVMECVQDMNCGYSTHYIHELIDTSVTELIILNCTMPAFHNKWPADSNGRDIRQWFPQTSQSIEVLHNPFI